MNKPSQTTRRPVVTPSGVARAGQSGSPQTIFMVLIVCLIALILICFYLLMDKPGTLRNLPITPQTQLNEGQPDTFGRPPGDPHYGHNHP